MSERWVQHKSGQGEKWKTENWSEDNEYSDDVWVVHRDIKVNFFLPKSEYIECEAPEVWTECTREVADVRDGELHVYGDPADALLRSDRWAWRGDALVIKRRQP